MGKRPLNADHMRHVGGKSPKARQMRKQIRQLEMEIERNPPRPTLASNPFAEWVSTVVDSAALVAASRREEALRQIEAEEIARTPPPPLAPGDFVILTMPMHSTRGSWTVVECACELCALGRHVAVDQPFEDGWRHIARAALRRRGEASPRAAEAWINGIAYSGPVNRGLIKAENRAPATTEVGFAWLSEMAALDVGGSP